jgi:glucosamine-phosphate N-acetyltransferase
MKAKGDYYVTVIEDLRNNKIIGSATLVVERKFIRNCAMKAYLEDVVVDDTYRGKQLGKLIVVTVTLLGELVGCYKMTLECKDKLIPFYRSMGYVDEKGNANSMTVRYGNQSNL